MPLSPEDKKKLVEVLDKTGLPSTFNGDRFDAFRFGLSVCLRAIEPLVCLAPEPPKKSPKE